MRQHFAEFRASAQSERVLGAASLSPPAAMCLRPVSLGASVLEHSALRTLETRAQAAGRSKGLVVLRWIAVFVAFCFGIGIGAGNSPRIDALEERAASQAETIGELEDEVETISEERDTALEEATASTEAAATAEAENTARTTELDERTVVLDDRESGLDERETALDERDADLDARSAELDERETTVAAAETTSSSSGSGSSGSGSSGSTSVYYANCSAARAAGAAPVYVGEPGYASHLDRDGDGVGCE